MFKALSLAFLLLTTNASLYFMDATCILKILSPVTKLFTVKYWVYYNIVTILYISLHLKGQFHILGKIKVLLIHA